MTFEPESRGHLNRRRRIGRLFAVACFSSAFLGVLLLAVLLVSVAWDGVPAINLTFLTSFPSRIASNAGIKAALYGTLWLAALTALFSIPVGIGAAIYLQEFAKRNWLSRFIQLNIANLAGVPSIVYGMLGLVAFVRGIHLGRTLLAGALTMSLLILPTIIVAAEEAIKAVPNSVRFAAFALGGTRWQTVKDHVLPAALPGILTGIILAVSRAIGETAPLIMIGALTYVAFVPKSPSDAFTALPIQIFNWASRPQHAFHALAAGAIIVLLVVLLSMNGLAIYVRGRYQKRQQW